MKLMIVTGMSGSGKSIALHTLEDLGYYCIDNLPVCMLDALAERLVEEPGDTFRSTAVGIDARARPDALKQVPDLVGALRDRGIECRMMFLEAQPETLLKRFSETRRKHPLTDENRSLAEAIVLERQLLGPLLSCTDLSIDTTHTNVHELRDLIRARVADTPGQKVSLLLQSFGFKHGVPRDVDFVFDMRCLPNPYWQSELRPLTGLNAAVAEFLEADPQVKRMRDDLIDFLERWIPRFEADGRSYLTIALGCTGGQHRSVYMTDQLFRHFDERGRKVLFRHRELP